MKYAVLLDSESSYLIESENGYDIISGCKEIIDYCSVAGYNHQLWVWEFLLKFYMEKL